MNAEAHDIARRAPRITAEDVFAAADALLIDGHRPTIDRVRMKLGRGSPNTINEHLDRWWTQLGARLRELPAGALPGVPESIASALLNLWTLALRESQQALRAALDDREAALTARSAQLDSREDQLQERESAISARLEAQNDALVLARTQLEEANRRAHTLEEALQQREREAQALRLRTVELEADTAEVRRRVQSLQDQHASDRRRLEERYDAQQVRWSEEVDRLRQSLKEEQKAARDLRVRVERLATERDAVRTSADRATAELQAAKQILERLEGQARASQPRARKRSRTQKPVTRPRGRNP